MNLPDLRELVKKPYFVLGEPCEFFDGYVTVMEDLRH